MASGILAGLYLCSWSNSSRAQDFEGLGDFPGGSFQSLALDVSTDGSVVVGFGNNFGAFTAFRWTAATGLQSLGGAGNSFARGVSADGSVVVGSTNGNTQAFRWTQATGMVGLGDLPGGSFLSGANDVSGDGSVVVGFGTNSTNSLEAFRWTPLTGMVGLGDLAGGTFNSAAAGVSADGLVIVGRGFSAAGQEAFRWTLLTGMEGLGDLPGGTFSSFADDANADGSVVVGFGNSALGQEAMRWTLLTGMVGLGDLPGGAFSSGADAVSADGSVVVGRGTSAIGVEAFRWTQATGMESIRALLVTAGVDMTGWTLTEATGVSANGNTIVGFGTNPTMQTEAWIARFGPEGIAGLTTPGAQQQSVTDLADDRFGLMAQQHGLAMPLLGGDKPMTNDSEVGVFGMGGSAAGGGYARYATGGGIAILAGVSYGEEAYQDAAIEDSLMGALALRYLAPGAALWRSFAEVGGWLAPEADMEFERTYMNGAGTATGVGNTHGDVSYYYARAGVVLDLGKREQVVVSGEIGRERLAVDGYTEALSAANPFNAQVSSGTDAMDLAKARIVWSFALAPRVDATLWGAGVYGFNRESDLVTSVAGLGVFTPAASDDTAWAEYGARVGYAVTEAVTFDVFVNGVSGDDDIDTRVHGGGGLRYRF